MNSAGLIVYGVYFMELEPDYICTSTTEAKPWQCERKDICSNSLDITGWHINWDNKTSIHNWIEQLDMYCTPKLYIGYIGAYAFAGAAIGCLFLPILGDKFGRWKVYIIVTGMQLPLYLFAALTKELGVIYFVCFWLGIFLIGRLSAAFILLVELSQTKHRAYTGTAIMFGDACAVMYIDLWYRLVPHVKPLIWVGFLLNIIAFVTAFWIPESPAWLISQGRI